MNVSAPIVMMGAVSPIARDMPMITPVRMPGIEYGTMWSRTVCHLVAPTANAPSRIIAGIERMASRVATITTGRIKSASVRPAVCTLWPSPNAYTNRPSARRPYTIEGTPARLVTLISMMSVIQFFGAYSSR